MATVTEEINEFIERNSDPRFELPQRTRDALNIALLKLNQARAEIERLRAMNTKLMSGLSMAQLYEDYCWVCHNHPSSHSQDCPMKPAATEPPTVTTSTPDDLAALLAKRALP